MKDVQHALDRLVPEARGAPSWEEVLRDARPRRRSFALQVAIAAALAALAALFVVAPWQGSERVGVLDRALAAVGDGPVLHLVLRDEWGGTLVDLKSGARKPLYSETEMWIDPERGFVTVDRFGGVASDRRVATPDQIERPFAVAASDYHDALESGRAKVVGDGVVDGIPVYWIQVQHERSRDAGRVLDWSLEVGVSKESYKPVHIREVRDGVPYGKGTRVLLAEQLPAAAADFRPAPPPRPGLITYEVSRPEISRAEASAIVGGRGAWLGPEFDGVPLGRISELTLRAPTPADPDTIVETKGVRTVYGTRLTFDGLPTSTPNLLIEQTLRRHPLLDYGIGKYEVPEGQAVLLPGGGDGRAYVSFEGTVVLITAHAGEQSTDLALAAARALRPVSDGSGGGG
jgi:hypothetical protein